MSPYIEGDCDDSQYELFSVVIHRLVGSKHSPPSTYFSSSLSGSTHSGHYTAYIRDVDNLGTWTDPVRTHSLQSCLIICFFSRRAKSRLNSLVNYPINSPVIL